MKDNTNQSASKFDFERDIKPKLDEIADPIEIKVFLHKSIRDYKQYVPERKDDTIRMNDFILGKEVSFVDKCLAEIEFQEKRIEISKAKPHTLPDNRDSIEINSQFIFKGNKEIPKCDLALLLLFIKQTGNIRNADGEKITDEEYMAAMGGFFGIKLNDYTSDLANVWKRNEPGYRKIVEILDSFIGERYQETLERKSIKDH